MSGRPWSDEWRDFRGSLRSSLVISAVVAVASIVYWLARGEPVWKALLFGSAVLWMLPTLAPLWWARWEREDEESDWKRTLLVWLLVIAWFVVGLALTLGLLKLAGVADVTATTS